MSFRINPDVDASTHAKISTGKKENKFGISWQRARAVYRRAAELPGIEVAGIDMHIGSQITDLQPFDDAFRLLRELVAHAARRRPRRSSMSISAAASAFPIAHDNAPPPLPAEYAEIVKKHVRDARLQGRSSSRAD